MCFFSRGQGGGVEREIVHSRDLYFVNSLFSFVSCSSLLFIHPKGNEARARESADCFWRCFVPHQQTSVSFVVVKANSSDGPQQNY